MKPLIAQRMSAAKRWKTWNTKLKSVHSSVLFLCFWPGCWWVACWIA